MDKRPTTLGLSPDKLAGLWNIGSDAEETEKVVDSDNKKTELLRDLLAGTLPTHSPKVRSRPKEQKHPKTVIHSVTDVPIEKLLQNPETDIAFLRGIKDYGKKLSGNAKSKIEYQVANTIYYAAIANALVSYDRRITTFSYNDLEIYFRRLAREKWIPEAIRGLFTKAGEYCRLRRGGS